MAVTELFFLFFLALLLLLLLLLEMSWHAQLTLGLTWLRPAYCLPACLPRRFGGNRTIVWAHCCIAASLHRDIATRTCLVSLVRVSRQRLGRLRCSADPIRSTSPVMSNMGLMQLSPLDKVLQARPAVIP